MKENMPAIRTILCQAAIVGGMDGPKGQEVVQMLAQVMHFYDGQLSTAEIKAVAEWFHATYGA